MYIEMYINATEGYASSSYTPRGNALSLLSESLCGTGNHAELGRKFPSKPVFCLRSLISRLVRKRYSGQSEVRVLFWVLSGLKSLEKAQNACKRPQSRHHCFCLQIQADAKTSKRTERT